jgi:hypothetical protein
MDPFGSYLHSLKCQHPKEVTAEMSHCEHHSYANLLNRRTQSITYANTGVAHLDLGADETHMYHQALLRSTSTFLMTSGVMIVLQKSLADLHSLLSTTLRSQCQVYLGMVG